MSNKTASELLAESAVPFDEACMLVMAMEKELKEARKLLKRLMICVDNLDLCEGGQGGITELEAASMEAEQLLTKEQGEKA